MTNKLNKETDAYKRKLEYIAKWNKTQKKITVTFNPVTEKDLLDWLYAQPSKATAIKKAMRMLMKEEK